MLILDKFFLKGEGVCVRAGGEGDQIDTPSHPLLSKSPALLEVKREASTYKVT